MAMHSAKERRISTKGCEIDWTNNGEPRLIIAKVRRGMALHGCISNLNNTMIFTDGA